MKQAILTALCALILANSAHAFSEDLGNDKGNGGDAILVNNEMVMRDFVARTNITPIEDNFKFLHEIPGLEELLNEIAKVNGRLAYQLLSDLLRVNFFAAEDDLHLLAPGQTGIGGPKAQIQLAIRFDYDVVLSPKFFSSQFKNQRAYLMIHEALHGVLDDSQGPLHHTRVRAFVNYLKTQRGNYDRTKMDAILQKKFYSAPDDLTGMFFEESAPSQVRCFVSKFNEQPAKFLGLSCDSSREKMNDYFNHKLGLKYAPSQEFSYDIMESERVGHAHVARVNLGRKGSIFDPKLREAQLNSCVERDITARDLEDNIKQYEKTLKVVGIIEAFLARRDVSAAEKKMLEDFLSVGTYKELPQRFSTIRENYQDALVSRKNAKFNKTTCREMWGPNSF